MNKSFCLQPIVPQSSSTNGGQPPYPTLTSPHTHIPTHPPPHLYPHPHTPTSPHIHPHNPTHPHPHPAIPLPHLVKSSQEDGPHHAGHVATDSRQKPGTLEGNVGGSHHQSLHGRGLEGEEVITSDAILPGSWDVRILGPAPCGQYDASRRDGLLFALLAHHLWRGVWSDIKHMWVWSDIIKDMWVWSDIIKDMWVWPDVIKSMI